MKAKYLIILFVLLVIGLSTYSQVLIKEGKTWSYAKTPSESPNRTYTSHYKIGEEVNVNDTIYNTVYVSSTYEPYDWVKTNVFGLYREQDSIIYNRRTIYFGGVEQDIEYLYFDFTKKTGDSIFICRFFFSL